MYVLDWWTVSALTRGLLLCLFPELRSNEGNKYKNNPRVGAETVRHESAYIILFLTRHSVLINDDKKDDIYTSSPCFARSVSFCWCRHNQLLMTSQWPDNCDAITWIVISNSLDIDFIHGDIHGRSCKKRRYCREVGKWGMETLAMQDINCHARYYFNAIEDCIGMFQNNGHLGRIYGSIIAFVGYYKVFKAFSNAVFKIIQWIKHNMAKASCFFLVSSSATYEIINS